MMQSYPAQSYQAVPPQPCVQAPFYSPPSLPPTGMVFEINSSQELNAIPPMTGVNLYWCAQENKIYIRNFSNGNLETKEYYLSTQPLESVKQANDNVINNILQRLSALESKDKKGGTQEWQL